MKIIVFGSNGMLGRYLSKYLSSKYEVVALTRAAIDIARSDESKLLQFLHTIVAKDDVIVNAAGIIPQRGVQNLADMHTVNAVFPHILAKFKNEVGCNVIHITTDCVFSGAKGGYVETDTHDYVDEYGKSKSLGEDQSITNIRTSIIGEEKANKKSLLEWVISNRGKVIDGYENHFWNGVTCLELAKLIDSIIANNSYWSGVRHVFSPEIVSKYELVNMINDIYDLHITVHKKTTDTDVRRDLRTVFTPMISKPLRDQILELKKFGL